MTHCSFSAKLNVRTFNRLIETGSEESLPRFHRCELNFWRDQNWRDRSSFNYTCFLKFTNVCTLRTNMWEKIDTSQSRTRFARFSCEEEQRETVTSTYAARPTAGVRHPGRTINFLSVSPISAAMRVVIFSPIRRGRDGEFCGGTGKHTTRCNNHIQ